MSSTTLTVNGRRIETSASADTPLLYLLRGELGLNSPRYGCGQEQCGACCVLIDGELAYSCTTAVSDLEGRRVDTVESLGTITDLHPLQQAFLELNAGQCGYCLSGILIAAARLIRDNPSPTRDDIASALDDHLCRCGVHNRILRAVERAAEINRGET